jgi:hypothetical protein
VSTWRSIHLFSVAQKLSPRRILIRQVSETRELRKTSTVTVHEEIKRHDLGSSLSFSFSFSFAAHNLSYTTVVYCSFVITK